MPSIRSALRAPASGRDGPHLCPAQSVRYVYQPIEGMFLVLVTNRQSNILEDLETLRLLAKIVPDYAPTLDEAGVARAAFELIFAFDEAISMGHKESITLSEVRENTEMASHEERLHKMILQSKMDEAKAAMRKKALEIEKTKIDRRRGAGPDAGMPGPMPAAAARMPDTSAAVAAMAAAASATAAGKASGMQLGAAKAVGKAPAVGVGRKAGVAILEQLRAEGEVVDAAPMQVAGHSAAQQQVLQQAAVSSDPVTGGWLGRLCLRGCGTVCRCTCASHRMACSHRVPARVALRAADAECAYLPRLPAVLVEERVSASLSKDGGVEATDLQGQMSLTINTDEATFVSLGLSGPQDGFQFKTHPNVDKQAYALGTLQLKDPSRPFPTGTPLVVLKWRLPSLPESKLPLLITCWPNPGADSTSMTLEYEASEAMDLSNVAIASEMRTGGAGWMGWGAHYGSRCATLLVLTSTASWPCHRFMRPQAGIVVRVLSDASPPPPQSLSRHYPSPPQWGTARVSRGGCPRTTCCCGRCPSSTPATAAGPSSSPSRDKSTRTSSSPSRSPSCPRYDAWTPWCVCGPIRTAS